MDCIYHCCDNGITAWLWKLVRCNDTGKNDQF
jgi:hypothetical protein